MSEIQLSNQRKMNPSNMESNCIMCGKTIHEQKNEIVSEIDGKQYTFDNKNCEIFFKKFKSVYGDTFNP